MIDRKLLIAVLAAGLALVAGGCDESNDEIRVLEPPLGMQETPTFPVDLADLEEPFTGPTDLTAYFNRAAGLHEMRVSIFPTTLSGPFTPNSESRRNWTWHDVQLEAPAGCYHWLIDGVNLGRYALGPLNESVFVREPVVVRIPSATDRLPTVGFGGQVVSTVPTLIASGALVFVLPTATTTFNPLEPWGFDPTEAVAVVAAARNDDFVDQPAFYTVSMLVVDRSYLAVAIKDTNRDLYYNPADDWWGYFEDEGGIGNILSKQDTGEKDSDYIADAEIVLRVPMPPPEPAD